MITVNALAWIAALSYLWYRNNRKPQDPAMPTAYAIAPTRGLLRLGGEERVSFLQGLVSNDVALTESGSAVYAAFLTPQGKFLHDMMIVPVGDDLFLEVERERASQLLRKLKMYKLRSKISLELVSEAWVSAVVYGDGADRAFGLDGTPGASVAVGDGIAFVDTRLPGLGSRVIVPVETDMATLMAEAGVAEGTEAAYDLHRITLGVTDGSRDLQIEKSTLAEGNLDLLSGVSFSKGCYMGQELTARTHYRGLVKRRLFPVTVTGDAGDETDIKADGKLVGELRSQVGDRALALLRLEAAANALQGSAVLNLGGATITPHRPDWLPLPEDQAAE